MKGSICKSIRNMNPKHIKNSYNSIKKKWAKFVNRNRQFFEKGMQVANKHINRYSTSLVIKSTRRYSLRPRGWRLQNKSVFGLCAGSRHWAPKTLRISWVVGMSFVIHSELLLITPEFLLMRWFFVGPQETWDGGWLPEQPPYDFCPAPVL